MSFALSRGDFNSASEMRDSVDVAALLDRDNTKVFLMDPRTRLAVCGRKAGGGAAPTPTALFLASAKMRKWLKETSEPSHLWFFGVGEDGEALVGAWLTGPQVGALPGVLATLSYPPECLPVWDEFMFFGADLDDVESLLATQGVALASWHGRTKHCSACGGLLAPAGGGWTRKCADCDRTQFPHIEPAVIVSVLDPKDRLLLVHNKAWDARRMSLLAGYVDAGETPERAVSREVKEESNLDVECVKYLGSQPWPRPRSLMFVYEARVICDEGYEWQPRRAGEDLPCATPMPDQIEVDRAQFFSRTQLRGALESGEVKVPGPASVAHKVIDSWLVEDGGRGLRDPETWAAPPPRKMG